MFQAFGDLDVRLAGRCQERALLDLRVDWLSVHARDEVEEIVMSRIGHGDRHVHASGHIGHREGDGRLNIRVRQIAEAIGDFDRCRREIKVLGDERDLCPSFRA